MASRPGVSRRAAALGAVALGVWVFAVWAVGAADQAPTGHTERTSAQAADRDTVGAAACATCHADVHDAWTAGRHSKMLQPATRSSVVGDFRLPDLRLRGEPYGLRADGTAFYITESKLSGAPLEHRVEFTLGSRRIQHYLTTVDRGRIVVLPPTWDVERRQWFDNVEIIRPDEGDSKIVQQWNKNCVGCHVSEQDNRYDAATKTYATTWRDEGTTCERCHGSGRAHVERYRAATTTASGAAADPLDADDPPRAPGQPPVPDDPPHAPDRPRATDPAPAPGTAADVAIVRPTRLDPARSTAVCAQCHSLRDVVGPGFRAGAAYDDHFVLKLEYTPRKEQDPVYWADGRPRRFSNDAAGLWQSQCYLRGGATCATCHDPHRPNVDRHAALAPTNNALCTRCHEGLGRNLTAHTKHGASSSGSACVECHMPREVVSIKATMRDHTIGLPTPENTVRHGIPNACTTCHADKPAPWAVTAMAAWWPDGRRARNVERATAFTDARAGKPEALPALLTMAADTSAGPLTRANAVGYLRGYADARAVAAIETALSSSEPVLRMVAASTGTQAALRPALARALDDPSRGVRVSALVSLVNLGTPLIDPMVRARFRAVSDEFAAQAALHEDDPATQTDLGLVRLLNDELDAASRALTIALGLNPSFPRAAFFLGLTRIGQGRTDEARALMRRVPDDDPFAKAARERLRRLDGVRR